MCQAQVTPAAPAVSASGCQAHLPSLAQKELLPMATPTATHTHAPASRLRRSRAAARRREEERRAAAEALQRAFDRRG
ncbi:hypothetical protein GCM10009863_54190 [Streptomyces axinellae]|uniref:Uncharacterized protein n=1 Tax=Streptomyces axinellae TaxID=552788 RepID=A0ABN3QP44_9ACTN